RGGVGIFVWVAHGAAVEEELRAVVDRGKGISRCQCNELSAPAVKEGIGGDHEAANSLARQACEGRIELGFATRVYDVHLPADVTSRGVHIFRLDLSRRIGRIEQHTD